MAISGDYLDHWRPTVVEVMAEHGGTYLWDRSPEPGPCGPEFGAVGLDPGILDVSSVLADQLAAWNEEWEDWVAADDDEGESSEYDQEWLQRGRELARALQDELAVVQVHYRYDEIDRNAMDDDAQT